VAVTTAKNRAYWTILWKSIGLPRGKPAPTLACSMP
jgi:hypothetical protein